MERTAGFRRGTDASLRSLTSMTEITNLRERLRTGETRLFLLEEEAAEKGPTCSCLFLHWLSSEYYSSLGFALLDAMFSALAFTWVAVTLCFSLVFIIIPPLFALFIATFSITWRVLAVIQLELLKIPGQPWKTIYKPHLDLTLQNPYACESSKDYVRSSLSDKLSWLSAFYFLFVKIPSYIIFAVFCLAPFAFSIYIVLLLGAEEHLREYCIFNCDFIYSMPLFASILLAIGLFACSSSLTVYWARACKSVGVSLLYSQQ